MSRFSELATAYPDVLFTFDTKMAAFHRQEGRLHDPVLSGRLLHIHLNDYAGTPGDFSGLAVLHLGEGNVDLAAISRDLIAMGYNGTVTLECGCMCPDGSLVPEKMNASLAVARRLLATRGKE